MNINPFWHNIFRKTQTDKDEIAQSWANTPLFAHIPFKVIQRLTENMPPRTYAAQEKIFKTGELGAGAALILSGKVVVSTGEQQLSELGPGDFFGEVALVVDEKRTADVIAVEETQIVFFLRSDLEEWIEQYPRQGGRFAINLAYVIAGRLRFANQLLMNEKGSIENG